MRDPITIEYKSGIAAEHAEQTVDRLASPEAQDRPIRLDFSRCRHVDASAGWRITNALRPHSAREAITAIVPPVASTKDFQGRWFLTFTRSGLGQGLAARAATILSNGVDVTRLMRDYYLRPDHFEGRNFVTVHNLRSEGGFNVDDFDNFLPAFRRLLRFVNIDVAATRMTDVEALARPCFEAAQNVRDHSFKAPLKSAVPIIGHLSMQYYKVLSRAGGLPGDFKAYVDRTEAHLKSRAGGGFVEIVVCDDGVGIAARQMLDPTIYAQPLETERRALIEAFSIGGSVKLRAHDTPVRGDPGYGFEYIIQSLCTLRAYATVRTGRLLALFDGTSGASEFKVEEAALGYLPGTALDIILPKPIAQLRFDY